jgi:hypothetical protein
VVLFAPSEDTMSDDKWEKVDSIARKQDSGGVVKVGGAENPLTPINQKIEAIRKQELDILLRALNG